MCISYIAYINVSLFVYSTFLLAFKHNSFSKYSSDGLFLCGVAIKPPQLNSRSTGALKGNPVLN